MENFDAKIHFEEKKLSKGDYSKAAYYGSNIFQDV